MSMETVWSISTKLKRLPSQYLDKIYCAPILIFLTLFNLNFFKSARANDSTLIEMAEDDYQSTSIRTLLIVVMLHSSTVF